MTRRGERASGGAVPPPDFDEWIRDEATYPDGSSVALHNRERLGFAGPRKHATDAARAEHGLSAVLRDFRRGGIGHALERAQLVRASRAGIRHLVTWTQQGNEPMQMLNRRLGYIDKARVLVYSGPLQPSTS